MNGNLEFNPAETLFLLDESLTPAVAYALRAVGYNFATIESAFGHRGVKDPEIIAWCRRCAAVWVHADDEARKAHRAQIQTSGIITLRLHRPGGRMTGKEQLRILSFVIPKLLERLKRRRAERHYEAKAQNPTSTPSLRPIQL